MTRSIKILGLQFCPKINDKIANYQKVSHFLKENKDFQPDIVVLPEVFNTGLDCKAFEQQAESIPDATTMFLAGFAEKYSTNIVGGSFIEKNFENKCKNTSLAIDRNGKILGKYSKIHTFGHFENSEGDFIEKGDKPVIIETDVARLGLSICYDLRFPELYRALTYKGAEILICAAAWPESRVDQLITLAKARAIENQCFLVLVNQTGKLSSNITNAGNSMVIGPRGDIIATLGADEGVLKVEINLSDMYDLRKEFPILEDRDLNAYNF